MRGVVHPVGFFGWLAIPVPWLKGGKAYREQLPQLTWAMEEGDGSDVSSSTPSSPA